MASFKVIILGNSAVGKTALIARLSTGEFKLNTATTVGIDFSNYTVSLDDGDVNLQIWDTAGQERFRNVTRSYYRGAHGIVYVYDVTNPSSFQDLSYWLQSVEETGATGRDNKPPVAIILGNKNDLANAKMVKTSEGEMMRDRHTLYGFYEVSAKTGENVEKAFRQLAFYLVDNYGIQNGSGNKAPPSPSAKTPRETANSNPFSTEGTVTLGSTTKDQNADQGCKC